MSNRARTRAIRERMNATGEPYNTAARALTSRPRLQLPLPDPITGPDACRACAGTGVTDDVVSLDEPTATAIIICWILCPECLGCGHTTHDHCKARDHADPEALGLHPEDDDDLDDDLEDEPEDECPSCHGRRWWPMQAFDNVETDTWAGGGHEPTMYWVRTPCGCTENILVPA